MEVFLPTSSEQFLLCESPLFFSLHSPSYLSFSPSFSCWMKSSSLDFTSSSNPLSFFSLLYLSLSPPPLPSFLTSFFRSYYRSLSIAHSLFSLELFSKYVYQDSFPKVLELLFFFTTPSHCHSSESTGLVNFDELHTQEYSRPRIHIRSN